MPEDTADDLSSRSQSSTANLTRAIIGLLSAATGGDLAIRVDVYHHLPDPFRLVEPPWLKASLTTTRKEAPMSQLTVDSNGDVLCNFDDDKGDTDAAAPAGAVATFSVAPDPSSSVATPTTTVAADPANAFGAKVTPGSEGDAGLFVCAFNGTALQPDNSTPIADPQPLAFTITAGKAVAASLSD